MKAVAMRISTLLLFITVLCSSQSQQPVISLGRALLHIGMDKQDALNKLSRCCKIVLMGSLPSLGDSSAMVSNKDEINDIFGNVYFKNGKVTGVIAHKDWNSGPESYKAALALFRLVDGTSHEHPVQATIVALTREMTNASSKS